MQTLGLLVFVRIRYVVRSWWEGGAEVQELGLVYTGMHAATRGTVAPELLSLRWMAVHGIAISCCFLTVDVRLPWFSPVSREDYDRWKGVPVSSCSWRLGARLHTVHAAVKRPGVVSGRVARWARGARCHVEATTRQCPTVTRAR